MPQGEVPASNAQAYLDIAHERRASIQGRIGTLLEHGTLPPCISVLHMRLTLAYGAYPIGGSCIQVDQDLAEACGRGPSRLRYTGVKLRPPCH